MSMLILGANGMLGYALRKAFPQAEAWGREDLDIVDEKAVRSAFFGLKPSTVINAAAYTDVDGAEENEGFATRVNGDAVGFLADACLEVGSRLVHYSTDYVFSGESVEGYEEDDIPKNPVNAYGRSKLVGENHVLERMKRGLQACIIRTSWLYGARGKNFVDTIAALAEQNKELRVVNDQHGKPTFAADLAQATRALVESGGAGVYHITNETSPKGITWYDFAREVVRLMDSSSDVLPCGSDDYPLPARRPRFSILCNTQISPQRPWDDALSVYLKERSVD